MTAVSISPHPTRVTTALAAEDRLLIAACLASQPGACESFVGRFSGLFAHVAARAAAQRGSPIAAGDRDDLVAEILLECLRNDAAVLRSFAGRSSLPTFLTVIARRVAVRHLGRGAAPRGTGSARQPMARDETTLIANREQVETLLGRLDGAEAQLLRLHHLEARSYGEISRLTGMPLGSIGPALSRAREKLRALQAHCDRDGGPITTDGSARSTGS
jgi:RNA polymerase sigma-70 factor (ECF subfamily)